MAYRYDDDEQQRFVGGGSASIRAGTGARGSGFTNFGSLQQANTGFDKKLTDRVSTLNQQTGAALDKKSGEANSLSWKPRQDSDQQIERMVNAGDQESVRAGLNQRYAGPRQSSVNLADLQSFSELQKLQNPDNIGALLADKSQAYTGGMRAFDSALFSGSGARGEALKGIDSATAKDAAANKIFSDKIAGFDAEAKNANSKFRKGLEGYYDRIVGGLDKRVKDERFAESGLVAGAPSAAGTNRKLFDGKVGTANRANQITQQEADALALLAGFTGRDSIARDANYRRAGIKEVFDPVLAAEQQRMSADKAARPTVERNQDVVSDDARQQAERAMKATGQRGDAARARNQNAASVAENKRTRGRGY